MKFIKCDGGLYNIDAISNICLEGNNIFLYPIAASGKRVPAAIECQDETVAAVVMEAIELFLANVDAVVFDAVLFAEGAAKINSQMDETDEEFDDDYDDSDGYDDEDDEDEDNYIPITVHLVLDDADELPSAIWRKFFTQ